MFVKRLLIILIICLNFPLFSFADDIIEEDNIIDSIEVSSNISYSNELKTNSKHIIALDRKCHSILYEKDAYSEVPMASTTKIMTAIIILENCDLSKTLTFSKEAANVKGSCLEVKSNSKMTINDTLYGLMLRSGNDCAVALAEYMTGSVENFAKLMNNKAKELNLLHTNFVTPHGLDNQNHYTTAYELALLTDYALKNDKFREIVGTKTTTIFINNMPRTISNTNELLGNLNGVYGVKTGFTFNAGRCLVSSCKQNDLDIIVVVLGADTKKQRTTDSASIIKYIFKNYQYVNLSDYIYKNFDQYKNSYIQNIKLSKTTTTPNMYLDKLDNYEFPLKINSSNLLKSKFYCINHFSPKIKKDDKIGVLSIYYNNHILCNINIRLENALKKNTWKYYFINILKVYKNPSI